MTEPQGTSGTTPDADPGPPRHATVIVNLAARRVGGRFDGERVVRYLWRRGVEGHVAVPSGPSETTAAARTAAERGHDLVFAIGGDGTQRDVALGLAGSNTALAPLAGGTANVLARELGIAMGLGDAIDEHLAGQTVNMDLGRAQDSGFLMMAGVGWDAKVAGQVPRSLKRWTGPLAYVIQGVRMLPDLRTRPARWSVGDETFDGPLAVMEISNTRLYGGVVSFAPDARANDGLFDVVALCPESPIDTLRLSARLIVRRLKGDACVRSHRVDSVAIETPDLPVQLDGDYAGMTPMRFWVEPGALLVRVPPGPLPAILDPSTGERSLLARRWKVRQRRGGDAGAMPSAR